MNVTSEITTYIPGPSEGLPPLVEIGLTDLPNGTPRDDRPASNCLSTMVHVTIFFKSDILDAGY